MADNTEDLDRLFAAVPAPAVPAALERRILDDFDRVMARWTFAKALRGVRDRVWPGAPAWQLAGAFALSLLIGVGVSAFAPLAPPADETASLFAVDQPLDIDGAQGV
jgi:hypothetical protein